MATAPGPTVTVDPAGTLAPGQPVVVSWNGLPADAAVEVVQCAASGAPTTCEALASAPGRTDAAGNGTVRLVAGTERCGPDDGCTIAVRLAGSPAPAAAVPIEVAAHDGTSAGAGLPVLPALALAGALLVACGAGVVRALADAWASA